MKTHSASHGTDARATGEKPTHDQIAALAYELYVKSGQPEGRSTEHWLRAEQLLQERRRAAPTPVKPIPAQDLRPLNSGQQTFARDERGSASRDEIRRETSPMRPASRQSLRRPERSRQAR